MYSYNLDLPMEGKLGRIV